METEDAVGKSQNTTPVDVEGGEFDIDPILYALNPKRGVGRYQAIQMTLIMFALPAIAFSVLSVVFIGYQPKYRCATMNSTELESLLGLETSNSSVDAVVYGQCSISITINQTAANNGHRVVELPCVAGFEYDSRNDISFFTEWDLTCQWSGLTELTQTLMMVGQGFGAFFLTALADRYGRRLVHISSTILLLLVAVGTALAPAYWVLSVCRFLNGALQQGSGLVGFTIFLEISPMNFRAVAGVIDSVTWTLCVMGLPLLAFIMQDYSWRYLQLFIAAFSAYSLIIPCVLDESMRWLVANNRQKEVEKILRKACRIDGADYTKVHAALMDVLRKHQSNDNNDSNNSNNDNNNVHTKIANSIHDLEPGDPKDKFCQIVKRNSNLNCSDDGTPVSNEPINGEVITDRPLNGEKDFSVTIQGVEMTNEQRIVTDGSVTYGQIEERLSAKGPIENQGRTTKKNEPVKYTLMDLMRKPLLRRTAMIICYVWVTNSVTYYGLMLTSDTLAGNRFLNFFLQGMVELPAVVSIFFAFKKFGRKMVISGFLSLTALTLLLSSVLLATVSSPVVAIVTNVLSLTGKFGISAAFCALFLVSPELFPTNLRTAGLGMSSAVARIGGMVAPYSKNLADLVFWAPGVIFGCMALLAAYVVKFLPETKGKPLPTTIEELQSWIKVPKKNRTKGKGKDKTTDKKNIIYRPLGQSTAAMKN